MVERCPPPMSWWIKGSSLTFLLTIAPWENKEIRYISTPHRTWVRKLLGYSYKTFPNERKEAPVRPASPSPLVVARALLPSGCRLTSAGSPGPSRALFPSRSGCSARALGPLSGGPQGSLPTMEFRGREKPLMWSPPCRTSFPGRGV